MLRYSNSVLLIALLSVCLPMQRTSPAGKIKAFVSIYPIAYFVERVGGPNVEVSVLVGPGKIHTPSSPRPDSWPSWLMLGSFLKWDFPSRRQSSRR